VTKVSFTYQGRRYFGEVLTANNCGRQEYDEAAGAWVNPAATANWYVEFTNAPGSAGRGYGYVKQGPDGATNFEIS